MKSWVLFGGGSYIYLMLGYLNGGLKGQRPDRLYGTSAGALLAALFAFRGLDEANSILAGITKTDDVFVMKDFIGLAGDEIFRRAPGLATYKPLHALIQKHIIGKPSVPVTLCRTNFNNGLPQYVTANPDGSFVFEGDPRPHTLKDFQDALLCSCLNLGAVDGFEDADKVMWGDGGYTHIGATSKALEDGAKELTLLLTGMFDGPVGISGEPGDVFDTIIRGFNILAHQEMREDVEEGIEHPEIPSLVYQATPKGDSSKFVPADIQANLKIGQATQAVDGKTLLSAVS